jgi:DNA-binding CsgD family transcriptional regulator
LLNGVTNSGNRVHLLTKLRYPARRSFIVLENILDDIDEVDARLRSIVPKGYSLAVNIRYFTPEFYTSAYPDAWVEIYTARRYALLDPVTLWCRFNEGVTRWSDIDFRALRGVGQHIMDQALGFGLRFGGATAVRSGEGSGVKSLLCGAREDRELSDSELIELEAILVQITGAVGQHAGLSEAELNTLRDLALGMTHNEIADARSVSPATVKKRLERARVILGARNGVHAVAIATRRGLILTDPTF